MALCLVLLSVESQYHTKLKFYEPLSQSGRELCVHRRITGICLYTRTLHLQNIPPRIRQK